MEKIDKRKIREKIEELRRKIEKSQNQNFQDVELSQKPEIKEEGEDFFYIFEGKAILISLLISIAIIGLSYYLETKTPLLSSFYNLIAKLFI